MKTFSEYIISKLLECHNYTKKYINQPIKTIITNEKCDIIAIGDIHGDIQLMLDTLTIGGVIKKTNVQNNNAIPIIRSVQKYDKKNNPLNYKWIEYYEWIGKNTIVVQVGDQIDRCRPQINKNCDQLNVTYDDEESDIEILLFFTNLHEKAHAVNDGSAVYSLLGNHELMNIIGDVRYVSYKNLEQLKLKNKEINKLEYEDKNQEKEINEEVSNVMTNEDRNNNDNNNNNDINNEEDEKNINNTNNYIKRRKNIFRRGGILAKFLASTRYSILIVNDYLFVHGGVLGSYIGSYIKKYNNIYREHFQHLNEKIKNYIINKEVKQEQELEMYNFIFGTDSPFYTRKLGNIKINQYINGKYCKDVKNIIKYYSLKAIIVGHTPQNISINGTCFNDEDEKNKLFRIDVASSKAFKSWPIFNLQAQVLKISNNDTREILKFENGKNGEIESTKIY